MNQPAHELLMATLLSIEMPVWGLPFFAVAVWLLMTTLISWIAGHMALLARFPCIPWQELTWIRVHAEGPLGWFKSSKFEIRYLDFRFTLHGDPGRSVEGKLKSLSNGVADIHGSRSTEMEPPRR